VSDPKTILVVEDDPDLQRGLAIRLRAAGYRVLVARGARAAAAAMRHHQPDLAIFDLELPCRGLDLLERSIAEARASMLVIVLTAAEPRLAERHALELGAAAYFQKPVSSGHLLTCIELLLDRVATTARLAS
jgi:two-component system KDP operon response regulator KdpE